MPDQICSFCELRVYQQAFELQQEIFQISTKWPNEEKFALIARLAVPQDRSEPIFRDPRQSARIQLILLASLRTPMVNYRKPRIGLQRQGRVNTSAKANTQIF